MTNQNRKRRSSLTLGEGLMFLAGGLFCLILITTAMMTGLFARYVTTGAGEDSARVAAFNPGASIEAKTLPLTDAGAVKVDCVKNEENGEFYDEANYTITVTSSSEVAVRYKIVINLGEALPEGIKATLYSANDSTKPLTETTSGTTLTYEEAGTFPAGTGQSAEHELVFEVDWSKINFTEETNDDKPDEETFTLNFDVDVTVVQID